MPDWDVAEWAGVISAAGVFIGGVWAIVRAVFVAGRDIGEQVAQHTAATDRLSDRLGALSGDVQGLEHALQAERQERRSDVVRIHDRLDSIGRSVTPRPQRPVG